MLRSRKYLVTYIIIFMSMFVLMREEGSGRTEKSFIQTGGELFEAVQTKGIFPDSKTFVDCTPAGNPDKILKKYKKEKENTNFDLKKFVMENFNLPKTKDEKANLPKDLTMEKYITKLWNFLERKPDEALPNSTLIALPNPYIVPGGRFSEIYYWDSYFTAEGLVVSGKIDMVENMTKNFAYLIDTVGHIPNGNRIYYESRSQPPFFFSMVNIIAETKGIEDALPYLPFVEKEYQYWMEGTKTLTKKCPVHLKVVMLDDGSILNRYRDYKDTPREESYREDIELCKKVNPEDPKKLYRDIRSAAESGWDFSSRWFKDNKNLSTIRTTEIIPVDLNSILYGMEMKLAKWNEVSSNKERARKYTKAAEKRRKAIQKYCWDKKSGFYFDYCFTEKKKTDTWSLAGAYPLFFNIANEKQAKNVSKTLEEKFLFPGGLVTTLSEKTGQQWDKPNGWAPLQWIAIKGLKNYGHEKIAGKIAGNFINIARNFYAQTGKMVEKYDVCDIEKSAEGGEYELQEGFGWTNGVIIKLIIGKNDSRI